MKPIMIAIKQVLRLLGVKSDEVKIQKVVMEGKVYMAILIDEEKLDQKMKEAEK